MFRSRLHVARESQPQPSTRSALAARAGQQVQGLCPVKEKFQDESADIFFLPPKEMNVSRSPSRPVLDPRLPDGRDRETVSSHRRLSGLHLAKEIYAHAELLRSHCQLSDPV